MFYITLGSLIVAILSFLYLLILVLGKFVLKDKIKDLNLKIIASVSVLGLFWLLTYALVVVNANIETPHLNDGVLEYAGTLGDLVGGVLNPVLALFGIIAAGLAFYVQYQANKQVQEQFNVQKFESQFYEMLRLHRENLNEMIVEGYVFKYQDDDKSKEGIEGSDTAKLTSGKKVFVTLLKEFEAIHLICKKVFENGYQAATKPMQDEVKPHMERHILDHAYYVFFSGISLYRQNTKRYGNQDKTGFLATVLDDYLKELDKIRGKHQKGVKEIYTYYTTGQIGANNYRTRTLCLSFNFKPFSGHQSILAHYYRHLFQTVKFVAKQDETLIPYESKRDYLRVLRSMLSNHEQILLYYNWQAGFGNAWEIKIHDPKCRHRNKFFTDFRMIHNIPDQMVLEEFKLKKTFVGDYLNFRYEKGRKQDDTLFELSETISRLP